MSLFPPPHFWSFFFFFWFSFSYCPQSEDGNLVFNPGATLAVEIPAKLLIANASSAADGGSAAAAPAATIDVAKKMNMMIEQMGAMQKEMDGMKAENAALKDQIAELGDGGSIRNPVTNTVVRLSCESLGEAPSGFKCPTKVHPDSMVIIDVDGLRALKFTSAIQGPLTIQNVAAGFDLTEYIQNLEHVAGDITVTNNAGLKTANFSALVRVDGGITFSNNEDATTLEFPMLAIKNTTVSKSGDTLVVTTNSKLEKVFINDFTHLYGTMTVSENKVLESFLLPALATMEAGSALTMKGNDRLDSVSFPAMTTCADFTFSSTPANSTVSLQLLEVITGTMVITIEGGHVNLPMLSNILSGGLAGKMKIVSSSQTEVGAMRVSWPVEVQNAFASNPDFVSAFGPYAIKWVVQKSGTYRISIAGGAGGGTRNIHPNPNAAWNSVPVMGGHGAKIAISLVLEKGEVLDLAPGKMGGSADWHGERTTFGGGGGTFVSIGTRNTPLVVAGGGAAAGYYGKSNSHYQLRIGRDAVLTQDGGSGVGGGKPPWSESESYNIGWDDSFTPKHGIGGSDAFSCYPACISRCSDSLFAAEGVSPHYQASCNARRCLGCLPPARGYASFKSCGYCAANEKRDGFSCGDSGGAAMMDCTHAGNGYSGGGDDYGTFAASTPYEGKGGGGSYYQHLDSTVLSATVDNTGPGSIRIEAL